MSNAAPRPRNYANLPEDQRPEPDDYYTLVTRRVEPDGSTSFSTRYYMISDLVHEVSIKRTDTVIEIHKKSVHGRVQVTFIPMSEVVRFDMNGPSPEFFAAAEKWCQNHHGVSMAEYMEMSVKGQAQERKAKYDRIRSWVSEELGVDSDRIFLEDEIEEKIQERLRDEGDLDG